MGYFRITIILKDGAKMQGIRQMNVDSTYRAQYKAWELLANNPIIKQIEYIFAKQLTEDEIIEYLREK